MLTCTFIGHRRVPKGVEIILKSVLLNLITQQNVKKFYVGHNGGFDLLVKKTLKNLQNQYSDIDYKVVLAYMPTEKNDFDDYSDTIYPEGLETVPKRFAIVERNKWMIKRADLVICYVENNFSNAYKFKKIADKKGKRVLNLANIEIKKL